MSSNISMNEDQENAPQLYELSAEEVQEMRRQEMLEESQQRLQQFIYACKWIAFAIAFNGLILLIFGPILQAISYPILALLFIFGAITIYLWRDIYGN